jgi:hypothetical protein
MPKEWRVHEDLLPQVLSFMQWYVSSVDCWCEAIHHTFRSKWFNRFDWQKQQLLRNPSASTTITTVPFGRPRVTVARPTQDSCSYTVGNRVVNANMSTISLKGLDGSPWSERWEKSHLSLMINFILLKILSNLWGRSCLGEVSQKKFQGSVCPQNKEDLYCKF